MTARSLTVHAPVGVLAGFGSLLYRQSRALKAAGLPGWKETSYTPADMEGLATSTWVADDIVLEPFGVVLGHQDKRNRVFTPTPGRQGNLPDAASEESPVCGVCGTRRARFHVLTAGSPAHPDPTWIGVSCLPEFTTIPPMVINDALTPTARVMERAQDALADTDYATPGELLAMFLWARDMWGGALTRRETHQLVADEVRSTRAPRTLPPVITDRLLAAEVQRSQYLDLSPITLAEMKLHDLMRLSTVPCLPAVVGLFQRAGEHISRAESEALARDLSFPPADAPSAGHVGVVGERVRDVEVMVRRVRTLPSGDTLVVFQDQQGRKITWFATGFHVPSEGDFGTLTGTVRRHAWFNEQADTRVNRCVFTSLLE